MRSRAKIVAGLKETGVVAVIRAESPADLLDVAKALHEGGVRYVEITMTVPRALHVIEQAVQKLPADDVVIGAGTVLDAETARAAILAGAGYIVAPTFKPRLVAMCRRYDVAVLPGAMTPTEILAAWEAGADIVKVFPAGVGGPAYFKDLKGPLPQIDIMPTGGVHRDTAAQFIKAGACAVGVGGALVGKQLIAARDFATIADNARDFVDIVRRARQARPT